MALTLTSVSQPVKTAMRGIATLAVPDGRKLKIDIPSVESVFNDGPPAGKQWRINLDIYVEELPA